MYTTRPDWLGKTALDLKAKIATPLTTVDLVKDTDNDAHFFRKLERDGIVLNQNQLAAVRHTEGPLQIIAAAGGGKSACIVAKIGYLVSVKAVKPEHILAITFTKKAATELKARIAGILKLNPDLIKAYTLHSLFLKILRSNGFEKHQILNNRNKEGILKTIIRNLGISKAIYPVETLLARISLMKNKLIEPDTIPTNNAETREFQQIYLHYQAYIAENKLLDFDDILVETYYLLVFNPVLLSHLRQQFKYIHLDEFQDCSLVEYEIIKALAAPVNNLTVVSDFRQSIYSFRGSDPKVTFEFSMVYPEAKLISLDVNYRSTASIVELGNTLMKGCNIKQNQPIKSTKNGIHSPQFLRPNSTEEEAAAVIASINENIEAGIPYKEMAILYRCYSACRQMLESLLENQMPTNFLNLRELFYDNALVKPIINCLRLSLDPLNLQALISVLPSLYLNRAKALTHLQQDSSISLLERLLTLPNLKPFQYDYLEKWTSMITELASTSPLAAIQKIRQCGYNKYLGIANSAPQSPEQENIVATLEELESSVSDFPSIPLFLNHVDKLLTQYEDMKQYSREPNANAVNLMSIHSSKGLEFQVVYLIGCSDGIIPHAKSTEANLSQVLAQSVAEALEEERRLLYVAITRAKEQLYISSPQKYKNITAEVSSFLLEAFSI